MKISAKDYIIYYAIAYTALDKKTPNAFAYNLTK